VETKLKGVRQNSAMLSCHVFFLFCSFVAVVQHFITLACVWKSRSRGRGVKESRVRKQPLKIGIYVLGSECRGAW